MILALATWLESLIIVGATVVFFLAVQLVWRMARGKVPEAVRDLVDQLVPVVVIAGIVVSILVAVDREQADRLVDGTVGFIPSLLTAIIIVILSRALGRIAGVFVETALSRTSTAMAARGRIFVSSLLLAIGVIIALQQLGISTAIILILVGALAFGVALTLALAIGLGSVPMARQVAAGRHVKERFEEGEMVKVGRVEGVIESIGIASTRLHAMDGGEIEVPNDEFLGAAVDVIRSPTSR